MKFPIICNNILIQWNYLYIIFISISHSLVLTLLSKLRSLESYQFIFTPDKFITWNSLGKFFSRYKWAICKFCFVSGSSLLLSISWKNLFNLSKPFDVSFLNFHIPWTSAFNSIFTDWKKLICLLYFWSDVLWSVLIVHYS